MGTLMGPTGRGLGVGLLEEEEAEAEAPGSAFLAAVTLVGRVLLV